MQFFELKDTDKDKFLQRLSDPTWVANQTAIREAAEETETVLEIYEMDTFTFWNEAVGFTDDDFVKLQRGLKSPVVKEMLAIALTRHIESMGEIETPRLQMTVDRIKKLLFEAEGMPDTAMQETPDAQIPVMAAAVINEYPQFAKDIPILISNTYMAKTDTGYIWLKSKQSLAEYFAGLPRKTKKMSWKPIHNLFDTKDLNNAKSSNGNVFKNTSKDYIELQKILKSTSL
jgi:hypothetical protein